MEWIYKKELENVNKIEEFETKYNVKFPVEFKTFVIENHAARPEPYLIDAEITKEIPVKAILSFDEKHKPEDIWSSYEAIKNSLPVNVIPFMSDEGGNYFCFDLDPLMDEASIVYWSHEGRKQENVADNFKGFVENFYDYQ